MNLLLESWRRYLAESHERTNDFILYPEKWGVPSEEGREFLENMKKEGHAYRGMTSEEYNNTVAKGFVKSRGDWSFEFEGTSFSERPGDGVSYANVGRTDPRKTGSPTYLIEVEVCCGMKRDRDGYIKTKERVPLENIMAIYEMYPEDDTIRIKKINIPDISGVE